MLSKNTGFGFPLSCVTYLSLAQAVSIGSTLLKYNERRILMMRQWPSGVPKGRPLTLLVFGQLLLPRLRSCWVITARNNNSTCLALGRENSYYSCPLPFHFVATVNEIRTYI